jgi:hypothetical protein
MGATGGVAQEGEAEDDTSGIEELKPRVVLEQRIDDVVGVKYSPGGSFRRYLIDARDDTTRVSYKKNYYAQPEEFIEMDAVHPIRRFFSLQNPVIERLIKSNLKAFGFTTIDRSDPDFICSIDLLSTELVDKGYANVDWGEQVDLRVRYEIRYKDGTRIYSDTVRTSTRTEEPDPELCMATGFNENLGTFFSELNENIEIADGRIRFYDAGGFDRNGWNRYGMNREGSYRNGDHYRGELRTGRKHGRGVYTWADGRVYSGDFVNDEMDGYGVLEETDGTTIFGYWTAGERDGPCLVMSEKTLEYQLWNEGELEESGPGGEVLSPDFNWIYLSPQVKNGRAHGKGNAISIDGRYAIRSGFFENGHLVQGTLIYPDGTQFSGTFRDGWLTEGKLVSSGGEEYAGDLERHIPQGEGALLMGDGTLYEGRFDKGLFDGEGVLKVPYGAEYRGSFRKGYPHGSVHFFAEEIDELRRYEMGVPSGQRR